jgi:hypothetical protein
MLGLVTLVLCVLLECSYNIRSPACGACPMLVDRNYHRGFHLGVMCLSVGSVSQRSPASDNALRHPRIMFLVIVPLPWSATVACKVSPWKTFWKCLWLPLVLTRDHSALVNLQLISFPVYCFMRTIRLLFVCSLCALLWTVSVRNYAFGIMRW